MTNSKRLQFFGTIMAFVFVAAIVFGAL